MQMPGEGDFARFFRTNLYKELARLEAIRKKLVTKIFILVVVLGCLGAVGLTAAFTLRLAALASLTIVVLISIGSLLCRVIIGEYVRDFKRSIIEKIIEFISPDLTYWQNGCISATQFNSSRIFTSYPEHIRGDDLVEGEIGSTKIAFSEVHAERRVETLDGHG